MSKSEYMITGNDFYDNESKLIFDGKYNFYKTGNWQELIKIIGNTYNNMLSKFQKDTNMIIDEILKFINKPNKKVIIFGCGLNGKKTYTYINNYLNVEIFGFCDNNKCGEYYENVNIYSMDDIVQNKESYLIIIPQGTYAMEMKNQLIANNFSPSQFIMIDIDKYLSCGMKIKERYDINEILLNNKIVLYGMGHHEFLLSFLFRKANVNIVAVCKDREFKGESFSDIPIITMDEYLKKYDDCYIICESYNYMKIRPFISDQDKVIPFFNLDYLQYFDEEIINFTPTEGQVFVDAGCFDLGTAKAFLKWSGRNCEKIYSFEPDKNNYRLCKSILESDAELKDKVLLFEKGLWDKDIELHFNSTEISGASYIDETNCPNVKIHNMKVNDVETLECTSIDNVLNGREVTFIKMDIEGSELKALEGAENTIRKYKPILAISIYHKPEDIVEIPSYIKSLVPEYKLYIRCYHTDHTETILYAICE